MKDPAQIIAMLKLYMDNRINETIKLCNSPNELVSHSMPSSCHLASAWKRVANFCNGDCFQRALGDQISEGLHDAYSDTIHELLQVNDLNLDQAILKGHDLKAAKKEMLDSTKVRTKPPAPVLANSMMGEDNAARLTV